MATRDKTKRDFSTIPEHLLVSIGKFLHTRIDILRFRAVCRSFRSALPPPPKLPFPYDGDLVPTESTVYAIESLNNEAPQTWILKVQESEPGRVQIKDALYRFGFKDLGKLSRMLPKSLNLLDYRVKEIATSYAFDLPLTLEFRNIYLSKVIFTTGVDEGDDGFTAMAKFGSVQRSISVWRNIDKKWTDIDLRPGFFNYIKDSIYHNHKFFVAFSDLTMAVDSKSLTVTPVAGWPPQEGYFSSSEDPDNFYLWPLDYILSDVYLVESCKDLLFITKRPERRGGFQSYFKVFDFKVFKLDEEKFEWVPVVGGLELEDRVLFVSRDSSYSVSAKEFPGCKGNCVYFRAYYGNHSYPGEDTWIFDLKDGKARKLSDIPGNANLFWPPPSWLKEHSGSAGCS